jgi:hypothetical protein
MASSQVCFPHPLKRCHHGRAFIPKARRIIIRSLDVTVRRQLCYFFNSHADLELGASYLLNHLRRFGLMMHIGVDISLPKTEAIYFPPPRAGYSNADAPRFDIRNADSSTVGFVDFTKEFKYLGSIIDSSLFSDSDVDMRIKAATSAFGALKMSSLASPLTCA